MSHKQDPDLQLDEQVARLSRDMSPQTDLWAALEPQLDSARAQKPRQRLPAFLWGTAASVLLVGMLLMLNYFPPADRETEVTAEASAQASAEASAEVQVVTAYETAIAERMHVLHRADSNWGDVEYQLQMFRGAVAEIRFALSFQPHNQELLQQLQDVYQQQLAWLQAVSSYNSASLS